MSVIRCNVDLFSIDQTVYEQDGDKVKVIAKVPMSNLGNFIAKYANEHNINEVHLNGFTDFTVDIKNKIIEASQVKFKNNGTINVILEKKGSNNE